MPANIRTIMDKCFVLAPFLANELGMNIAKALKRVAGREQGADEELIRLYSQIPSSMKALA